MPAMTEENQAILEEFFIGLVSGEYYDGSSYQLYLDTDDNSLFINREASNNTWLQRDDGSLIMIEQVSGYTDMPEEERYKEGCNLMDYGYEEWLEMITERIKEAGWKK